MQYHNSRQNCYQMSSVETLTAAHSAVDFNGLCMTTTVSCLNRYQMWIIFITELRLNGNCVIIPTAVKGWHHLQYTCHQSNEKPHLKINIKNCSLSIVLTATDQKLQKSLKRWYYPPSHRLNVNVMLDWLSIVSLIQCFDTDGWTSTITHSAYKNCTIYTKSFSTQNKIMNKTEENHFENGYWSKGNSLNNK